ncbi:uncharacterized protein BDZ99DRAFT_567781 [Mytilinidion resinicola]|uniref:Uncharacterized protein n=1 Tax=Mytilinidion resinicola TaxID=574789 RepID=A0A6A6YYT2_9PEZI|nr:uncharacterized protein BDZ99DRAFT_567781 [Mytilinidion resinicola]KAF2814096.1 hypothetical protein BDZ99DRAFT_567781 [Mytilinidion resinicola]
MATTNEIVGAVASFYDFLANLHIPRSALKYPPYGGWPDVDGSSYRPPKNEAALDVIRHLPYLHSDQNGDDHQVYEKTAVWDYSGDEFEGSGPHDPDPYPLREIIDVSESEVVLAQPSGGHYGYYFILETATGIISLREFDYCEWEEYPASEFFEVIKSRFRSLEVYPIDANEVEMAERCDDDQNERLADIFHSYGWPSAEFSLGKDECMRKIRKAWREENGWSDSEDDDNEGNEDVQQLTEGIEEMDT